MIRRRLCSLAVCAAILFSVVFPPITAQAEGDTLPQATGNTYYVSTLDGNDRNSGKSETEALYSLTALSQMNLQPGDRVLLERGSNFYNDFLHLRGVKGTQEAPIVIDAYGDSGAALPVINTNGQGIWYQDYGTALDNAQHVYRGYVSSSILLYDCEYIELNNIAMTNRNLDIDVTYNSRSMMNRTGVAVVAQDGGTLDHIYLRGLDIQDVEGNVQDKHMNNGGIYFTVFKPHNEGTTGVARYNDILIEDCYLKSVNRWGIALAYTAYHAKFPDSTISNETAQTYGMTNVVIRNNYLEDVGGDAITTMYCYRPVVEYNVANGAASQINAQDYKGEGTSGDKPFGCVAASVWPWKCKDAVFQYNEVYNTHNDGGWNGDGQAWDADWGDGTVYQYNYSHDNEGGCFMICLQHAYNSVFRYNISQNDSTGVIVAATSPRANIYNNTFYIKENVPFVYTNSGSYGTLDVKNNIIYYAGSTPKNENWQTGSCSYANNIFVNYNNVPTGENNIQMTAVEGASLMVDPGKGGTGNAQGSALNTLDGYKLQDGSPAIGAGTKVETPSFLFEMESQGVYADQDFFGNSTQGVTPDVGAHQYSKLTGLGSDKYQIQGFTISHVNGDTAETVLSNLIVPEGWSLTLTDAAGQPLTGSTKVPGGSKVIVEKSDGSQEIYTVAMNAQADILSSPFERQSGSIHVPDLAQVKHLLDALELSWGASAKVMYNGVEQDQNVALTSDMTLQITAEDGVAQTMLSIQVGPYSILESIQTEDGQQGEIWFAQQRISSQETNAAYKDLTSWHADWKGWEGFSSNQWAFVGANSGGNVTNIKIVDETSGRDGFGHTLGFRAPLDGVISITGLDAIVNNGNNTGTIWASLTKNGEPLVAQQQVSGGSGPVNFNQDNIQVAAGDMIRFEVQNKEGTIASAEIMAPMVVTYTSVSDKPTLYKVSYQLTNLTADGQPVSAAENQPLSVTLTPANQYSLPEQIQVTMAGAILTSGQEYTYDPSSGTINLAAVTGNVIITADGVAQTNAPVITTTTLKDGKQNEPYSDTLAATSDTPVRWSVTSGSLPSGLTLDEVSGVISGTPVTAGTVTFTVTATNDTGSTSKELSIFIIAKSAEKRILSFAVPNGTSRITGTQIEVTVPYGTDVTSLTPTIAVSERASVSPASGVTQDFSDPINYTVTAEDGSQQIYTVTVVTAAEGTYIISADTVAHGTILPDKSSAAQGELVHVSLIPDNDYQVKADSLKVYKTGDDTAIVPITNDSFLMPGYAVTVTAEFEPSAPAFVAVANIINVPSKAEVGKALTLSATVMPNNATNQQIIWTVKDDGGTGAAIQGGALVTVNPGVAVVTATIASGAAPGVDYAQDFTITVSDRVVKYHTVTFESNGGTSVAPQTVEENGLAVEPAAPSRSGYTFTGWYLDAACTQKFDFNTAITKDLTLYAGWKETGGSSGGGSSSSGGGGSSSGNQMETTTNPDGSTTTTVTKPDGTVTETTVYPDGGKTVVETKPDGSGITTITRPDGASSVTTVDENGKWESEVKVPEQAVDAAEEKGENVTLPLPNVPNTSDRDNAPTITVQLPEGDGVTVEIPVDGATSGTVAVLVKEDGTEEIIKTTITTENGVKVTLSDGQRVKIVDNSKYFSDVPDSYWGAQAIDFASSRELFGGTGPNTFSPETAMTRGMMVTVLARMEGVDTSTGSVWYEAGQKWAVANGISDGTNMEQGLTREQLALMLYRYAGEPAVSGDLSGYADGASVNSWATQAVTWAVQEGLISGVGNNTLNPQGQASRAQVATILTRFIENGLW